MIAARDRLQNDGCNRDGGCQRQPGKSLRTNTSALAVRIAVTPPEEALFAIGGRRAPGLVPVGIAAN